MIDNSKGLCEVQKQVLVDYIVENKKAFSWLQSNLSRTLGNEYKIAIGLLLLQQF